MKKNPFVGWVMRRFTVSARSRIVRGRCAPGEEKNQWLASGDEKRQKPRFEVISVALYAWTFPNTRRSSRRSTAEKETSWRCPSLLASERVASILRTVPRNLDGAVVGSVPKFGQRTIAAFVSTAQRQSRP